jgi:hypothetical protein
MSRNVPDPFCKRLNIGHIDLDIVSQFTSPQRTRTSEETFKFQCKF